MQEHVCPGLWLHCPSDVLPGDQTLSLGDTHGDPEQRKMLSSTLHGILSGCSKARLEHHFSKDPYNWDRHAGQVPPRGARVSVQRGEMVLVQRQHRACRLELLESPTCSQH